MPARFHVPVSTFPLSTLRLRPVGVGFAVLLVAALVTGLLTSREPASGLGADASLPGIGSLVPDETLDPRIVGLELSGRGWTDAVNRLDAALFDRAEADRRLAATRNRLQETRVGLVVGRGELERARASADTVGSEITKLESVLRARALSLFVGHGESDEKALISPSSAVDEARISELASEVDESQFATRRILLDRQSNLESQLSALYGRVLELGAIVTSLENALTRDQAKLLALGAEIEAATDGVRTARRNAYIPGMDFSVVALDAYLRAETLLSDQDPECGIQWWMIAGIGRVESRHGELGGRSIRADGTTDSPIIGIALDGAPGVRAVVDTDGGALDKDPKWDRAVGPMQFIPETWRIRSGDANGDGVSDPHNIYDAAFTTGRYLCVLGGDLTVSSATRSAYYGYNTSTAYVDTVSRHAQRYSGLKLESLPEAGPGTDD